jgi:predicted nuclease of predicted toxin-antitoxin system
MRILLDACVWGKAQTALREAGHDVVWAGEWSEDPGDREILRRAYRENRVLVTLDKDFGELAILRRQRHSGIIRLVNISAVRQAEMCLQLVQKYGDLLGEGAIITADSRRIRIRPPDRSD